MPPAVAPSDISETDPPEARKTRKNNPDATRANILEVAIQEFAENGLSGARVDVIAQGTRTSKRMIYYYFGSKEGLYLAALERAYLNIRGNEGRLELENLSPPDALRRLIESMFDYHQSNPSMIRLFSIENIHHASFLKQSKIIRELNVPIIAMTKRILEDGYASGDFTQKVDPFDLHVMISSMCFFRISNQYTLGTVFDRSLTAAETTRRHRRLVADMVLAYVASGKASNI
ncbi:TetR/AcrR family transcriptional regulator [Terrarubrum flagellatum]|uniref:TetR/AcrR family transcriptional regulator n=1 Tax=Terrirubrum flagellatum TaxID=2895980 RepID=UPI003145361C